MSLTHFAWKSALRHWANAEKALSGRMGTSRSEFFLPSLRQGLGHRQHRLTRERSMAFRCFEYLSTLLFSANW
jgi:hypothetical protein